MKHAPDPSPLPQALQPPDIPPALNGAANERRADRRLTPGEPLDVELSAAMDVEVLDVSQTGVLLACDQRLAIGYRLQLRLLLGVSPFTAWIEVRRVAKMRRSESASERYLVGARFAAIDAESAGVLKRFLPSQP